MNEIWEKVYKAYIFSFPLMMMDATMRVSTNTAEPDDSGKAPANRWMHAKHLASASFRQVVTPNVDTLYSQDEPEGHRSNWLPVSGEGFHLFLRIYRPEDSVFDGNWAAPSIRIRQRTSENDYNSQVHIYTTFLEKTSFLHVLDTGDGFLTVSFLLPFYAKMLKNGLNSGVLSTAAIKLGKLEAKKLTRHKQSHKQSFKLSYI